MSGCGQAWHAKRDIPFTGGTPTCSITSPTKTIPCNVFRTFSAAQLSFVVPLFLTTSELVTENVTPGT